MKCLYNNNIIAPFLRLFIWFYCHINLILIFYTSVYIYFDIRPSFLYLVILLTLCLVTCGSCVGACVWFNSGVLVDKILFRLWLKSLAVGGTLERIEGREGEGTSELRWQIKVGCVHTKKDSMLQTSLVFCSVIALHPPLPVLSPSSLCRRCWCVATLWR